MLERFLRFGAVAAGATLAISLSEYFVGNHVDRTLSWILAVTISAIAAHSVDFLLITVPMQFSTLRRILNAMFTIEGYWYESVNSPDHPHTYACIEYDPKEKSFRYTGHNFTSQYELNASFSSESFEVRRHAKQISFTFRAEVYRPARSIVSGYGRITLYSDGKRSFTRADGSFVESYVVVNPTHLLVRPDATPKRSELPMQEVSFHLDRIDDSVIKSAIGRSRIKSHADIVAVLKAHLGVRRKEEPAGGIPRERET